MARFDDNDDEFNDEFGGDFFSRWEEFNRMMNNKDFNNKFRSDLEELMRLIASRKRGGDMGFRIIPLNNSDMNDFNIPDSEMDVEKGKDENGDWETKHWSSPDGSMSFTSFTRSSSFGDSTDLPDEIAEMFSSKLRDKYTKRVNPEEAKKIKLDKLQKTLNYLVEQENYEKAAEVKKMIDDLNKPSEEKTEEN